MDVCASNNLTESICSIDKNVFTFAVLWSNCSDSPTQQWYQVGLARFLLLTGALASGVGTYNLRKIREEVISTEICFKLIRSVIALQGSAVPAASSSCKSV